MKWSEYESARLEELVKLHGPRWSFIAEELAAIGIHRTGPQCCTYSSSCAAHSLTLTSHSQLNDGAALATPTSTRANGP